jgi:hypothetical protein
LRLDFPGDGQRRNAKQTGNCEVSNEHDVPFLQEITDRTEARRTLTEPDSPVGSSRSGTVNETAGDLKIAVKEDDRWIRTIAVVTRPSVHSRPRRALALPW